MSESVFSGIKQQKRRAIMEAALSVFAAKGFQAASTREITDKAGVAHGLLFYYFKDKETLALEMMGICLERLEPEFLDTMQQESDFLKLMLCIMQIKLKQFAEYPEVYQLFLDSYIQVDSNMGEKMDEMRQKYAEKFMPLLARETDDSKFRDDIDISIAKRLVYAALNGMGDEYIRAYQRGLIGMEDLMKRGLHEGDEYMKLLETLLYK